MVSKRDARYVVYPCYLDAGTPRPLRRVPKALAVRGPSAEEVAKAALALRLSPVLEKGRAHPSRPWAKEGRVLLEMRGEKGALLRQIAQRIREARGVAQAAAQPSKAEQAKR